MSKPKPCVDFDGERINCGHTDAEHRAFDQGHRAAVRGKDESDCPYETDNLIEAWLSGLSAGQCSK